MNEEPVMARWVPPELQRLIDAHPRYHRLIEAAYWAGVHHNQPYVTADPAMRSGQPCVNGTRVPVESVAYAVWLDGGAYAAASDYDLTRHDVLVACWYAGTYGLPGRRTLTPSRMWRERWGPWAREVHDSLWSRRDVGGSVIPDPPTKE